MPDLLRVRYLGDAPATIPLAGRELEPDCVFELAAKLVTGDDAPDEDADHVLVEMGGQRHALAKSLFVVETPRRRSTKQDGE